MKKYLKLINYTKILQKAREIEFKSLFAFKMIDNDDDDDDRKSPLTTPSCQKQGRRKKATQLNDPAKSL